MSDSLLLGWATRDISPPAPTILEGQLTARVGRTVHDTLTVTALALSGPAVPATLQQAWQPLAQGPPGLPEHATPVLAAAAIILTIDRVNIPPLLLGRLRQALSAALPEFDARLLLASATHTHSAPTIVDGIWPPLAEMQMTASAYLEFMVARAVDACVAAWRARAPGRLVPAWTQAAVAHNRRARYANGQSIMYGQVNQPAFLGFEGGTDHSLDLLLGLSPSGDLTGLLVNLPCPAQCDESSWYSTADFWHEIRTELRRRLGADLPVLAQCGAAGDLSPHLLLQKSARARMLALHGWTIRQWIGDTVAQAVERAVHAAHQAPDTGLPLWHAVRPLHLPMLTVTPAMAEAARAELARQPPERGRWIERLQAVLDRYEAQQRGPLRFPMELHALRLGQVAMVSNGFELFHEYGQRLKGRAPAAQTLVVQLAGHGMYLPTATALAGGGYSGIPAVVAVGPEGGEQLIEDTLATLAALWPPAS